MGVLWRVWGSRKAGDMERGLGFGPRPGRVRNWGRLPEGPSLGAPGPIFQSVRNTAIRIFRVGLDPRPGGWAGGVEEALLMLFCLADFQGADDASDVFFWYLQGAGGGKEL